MRPIRRAFLFLLAIVASTPFTGGCVARIGNRSTLSADGTGEIVDTAKRTGAQLAGPIPLPTEVRRFTVLLPVPLTTPLMANNPAV